MYYLKLKPLSLAVLSATSSLSYAENLLPESEFNNGSSVPWVTIEDSGGELTDAVVNDEFRINVTNTGENPWSAQARYSPLALENGHTYRVRFSVRASNNTTIYSKLGIATAPYTEYWNKSIPLQAGVTTTIDETFTMNQDVGGIEFAFHLGGSQANNATITLDNIFLDDPDFTPPENQVSELPVVRVNQTGYLPTTAKKATVVNSSNAPISWQLINQEGSIVSSGETTVFGNDPASRDHVHIIDFSDYNTPGQGYVLRVPEIAEENNQSHPFDISSTIYSVMMYDALQYFYHNRSGIEITMPYAGREDLARPAGHPSDVVGLNPNISGADLSYELDVTGGWYDAGDHGKYVVNGGISLWTMMNQYERSLHSSFGNSSLYQDGEMNIPENDNNIPDILDEARWQMEFMLSMQVPAGKQFAGMVHHKMHDENWTGLPTAPHEDTMTRYLRPVSTAATLNVAATAAQSYRLWKTHDLSFANTCLAAAETAWQAAQANPTLFASPSDGTGGGPYPDNNLTDEFYWAAAELYISTGKQVYRNAMSSSNFHLRVPYAPSWQETATLGTLSLALVPNGLSQANINTAKQNIITTADAWLNNIATEGYGTPLKSNNGYPWGSNSFVMNIMVTMAYAYDYTNGNEIYLNGVSESMDYLLGRNAMDQSYLTGYGERPLMNPHHRFWAFQLDASTPTPPPGVISGGPNTGFEDPYIQGILPTNTAPQKAFLDHIESWSTNEITINWNSPFAWASAFLHENSGAIVTAPIELSLKIQNDNIVVESDTTEVGFTYEIRSSETLSGGFTVIEASMQGDGISKLSFTDLKVTDADARPRKFYRLYKY